MNENKKDMFSCSKHATILTNLDKKIEYQNFAISKYIFEIYDTQNIKRTRISVLNTTKWGDLKKETLVILPRVLKMKWNDETVVINKIKSLMIFK